MWKVNLNSDGQQFHQYQQNEQSPLIWTHWTQESPWHMIQVLCWDRHKICISLLWFFLCSMICGDWEVVVCFIYIGCICEWPSLFKLPFPDDAFRDDETSRAIKHIWHQYFLNVVVALNTIRFIRRKKNKCHNLPRKQECIYKKKKYFFRRLLQWRCCCLNLCKVKSRNEEMTENMRNTSTARYNSKNLSIVNCKSLLPRSS